MPGTPRSRVGAGGSVCTGECERVRALRGAGRHVGGAGGARQPAPRPLLQRLPRTPPGTRSLPSPRGASTAGRPPPPPPPFAACSSRSPPLTPYLPTHFDYCGERRGEPFGEPQNPRLPPRWRPQAGDVRAPFLQPRGLHCSPSPRPSRAGESQSTPQRGIFVRVATMSGPWRCGTG